MALAQMTVTWGLIAFQCAPLEEFAVETAYEHADYLTVSSGEYSRPHGAKLKTLSFETLVTPDKETWLGTGVGTEIVKQLQDACASGEHYELKAIERAEVLANFQATLRSVRVTTKAGEPGTRYLSVAFVEYRSVTFDSTARPGTGGGGSGGKYPSPQKLRLSGKKWLEAPTGWKGKDKKLSVGDLAKNWYPTNIAAGQKAIILANKKYIGGHPVGFDLRKLTALKGKKTLSFYKGTIK
jgi:hypothetical protein